MGWMRVFPLFDALLTAGSGIGKQWLEHDILSALGQAMGGLSPILFVQARKALVRSAIVATSAA